MVSKKRLYGVFSRFILCLAFLGANQAYSGVNIAQINAKEYPRLLGMNIGAKNYDSPLYQQDLAKLDIVILGFYRGWQGRKTRESITSIVRKLKKLNPNIMLGQYTILNETYDNPLDVATADKQDKLNREGWWLTRASGEKVQWTSKFNAWDINITEWAKQDNDGLRYPEWLVRRDFRVYFEKIPEFDIWYFDNVMKGPRVRRANWKGNSIEQSKNAPEIMQAYRRAHAREWSIAGQITDKKLLLMGNADNDLGYDEYRGKLHGVFNEALMGRSWSIENRQGWMKMMERYFSGFENTAAPHLVGFNVQGDPKDYKFFRFAYGSCLMGDGYFSFTDINKGYSTVPWFDEYNFRLGKAFDGPQKTPWYKGVYRRRFEHGIVLVNPGWFKVEVPLGGNLYHLSGSQDIVVNNGNVVNKVILGSKDAVVLSYGAIK